jgi:hypothetical protein
VDGALIFAESLRALSGPNIARKTNSIVRSYIQNAHLLAQTAEASFRVYLVKTHGNRLIPPVDPPRAERIWVKAIARDFFKQAIGQQGVVFSPRAHPPGV